MDSDVSDFNQAECELVADLLQERYGAVVGLELADSGLKLDPASDEYHGPLVI